MDFSLTNDHNELADLTRVILRDRVAGDASFDPELWRGLAKAGVLAAALPEAAGGSGLGLLGHCAVLIEIGRTLAAAPYLPSIALGASAIATFGTTAQLRRWAEPAAGGDLLLAVALPPAGTQPATPAGTEAAPAATPASVTATPVAATPPPMRAEFVGGEWLLSGSCSAVPAAPWADVLLIVADVLPAGRRVFVLDKSQVRVQPQQLTDGATAGLVTVDNLHLAAGDRVLGDGDRVLGGGDRVLGGGDVAADWLIAHGTVGVCALQLGVCERALELTAEHARTRVQFGRPIGTFQAVGQRLADAWIDVEAIRLTLWQAAWRLAEGRTCDNEIATAKFWAADAGHRVAHTAVHVHGGIGIDVSYPLHRYFAAAKHNEFYLGDATEQLLRIGHGYLSRGG